MHSNGWRPTSIALHEIHGDSLSKPTINIQDGFLFQNLKESTELNVELLTGAKICGRIRRFDRFAIVLEVENGDEVLVYKHAVCSIGPTA